MSRFVQIIRDYAILAVGLLIWVWISSLIWNDGIYDWESYRHLLYMGTLPFILIQIYWRPRDRKE